MTKSRLLAKKKIIQQGISIKEWAAEKGFSERSVRAVLSGHNKGNFGEAHKIAVALEIKGDPKQC